MKTEIYILCHPRADGAMPNIAKAYNDRMYFTLEDAKSAQIHYKEAHIFKVMAEVVSDYTASKQAANDKKYRHWYIDEGCGFSVMRARSKNKVENYLREHRIVFCAIIREATKDEVDEYASQRTIDTAD